MQSARPRILRRSVCNASRAGDESSGMGTASVNIPVRNMRERTSNIITSSVLSAVREVERFIDEREVRNDIAEDCVFEKWPVLPRRVVRVAASNGAVRTGLESNQNRTAPAFNKTNPKQIRFRERNEYLDGSSRNVPEEPTAKSKGLEYFVESHLHSSRHIARRLHNQFRSEPVVRRPRMVDS